MSWYSCLLFFKELNEGIFAVYQLSNCVERKFDSQLNRIIGPNRVLIVKNTNLKILKCNNHYKIHHHHILIVNKRVFR